MADNPFEISPQVRDQAERNISLARQFYEQWMDGVKQVMNMWSAVPGNKTTAQFDTLRERAVRFSKENAEAAFALAEKLAQAKDLQQLMTLQSHFIQEQMRRHSLQAREIGGLMSAAMTTPSGSQDQSKTSASTTPPGPPPSGPATPPGVRAPDERAPGTRKKGTPEHDLGPLSKPPKK